MRVLISLVSAFLALCAASSVSAQTSQYGDVSYHQPHDCSSITKQNKLNPYAYLFREQCEQSSARTKQSIARLRGTAAAGRIRTSVALACRNDWLPDPSNPLGAR
jgi:hypothetical protein